MTDPAILAIIQKAKLENATILDLSYEVLLTLPEEVQTLTHLQSLNIGDNKLESLPEGLGELSNLKSLDIGVNNLKSLPDWLDKLINLQTLCIAGNQLKNLPESIGKMSNLQTLDIRGNQLENLPDSIGRLGNLKSLYISHNKLENLPESIGRLGNLKSLYISHNKLENLPKSIGKMRNLQTLHIRGNQLENLPEWLGELGNLKSLHISYNKLENLPESIGKLNNLQILDMSYNKLENLPESIGKLNNLEYLDIDFNKLENLPDSFEHLLYLQTLSLKNNPLPLPPELLRQNNAKLILQAYFESNYPLNEAKLLIVGQGAVGKTSLMRRLTDGSFDNQEPQTHVINVRPQSIKIPATDSRDSATVQLNIWDFGGQEIMHNTHQFFMTSRSLYLIVLNARKEERDNDLTYWLNLVNALADHPPILIVINKIDLTPSFELDECTLQYKYPNIKGFARVSCETREGLAELQQQIGHTIAYHLSHIHDRLPEGWFNLKQELQTMQEHTITYQQYQEWCKVYKLTHESIQRNYLTVLHELGAILSYQDDPRLRDYGIMNRQWVVEAIYTIINAPALTKRQNGKLALHQLATILDSKKYPSHTHMMLLNLMQKFELCYPFDLGQEPAVLIPDLLPKNRPEYINLEILTQNALTFYYQYETLPASILCRCMVRSYKRIVTGNIWRNGVVLQHQNGQQALLWSQPDPHIPTLAIYIKGEGDKRMFLESIRYTLENIHPKNLKVTEVVPLPNHPQVTIPYQNLVKMVNRGIKEHYIAEIDEFINPAEVLSGVSRRH